MAHANARTVNVAVIVHIAIGWFTSRRLLMSASTSHVVCRKRDTSVHLLPEFKVDQHDEPRCHDEPRPASTFYLFAMSVIVCCSAVVPYALLVTARLSPVTSQHIADEMSRCERHRDVRGVVVPAALLLCAARRRALAAARVMRSSA